MDIKHSFDDIKSFCEKLDAESKRLRDEVIDRKDCVEQEPERKEAI